jgi:hemerythrin-like domain-containing protein
LRFGNVSARVPALAVETIASGPNDGQIPPARSYIMSLICESDRRTFLKRAATTSGALLLTGIAPASRGQPPPSATHASAAAAEEISPAEDLMREHGVLSRILLIYDEAVRRIESRAQPPLETLVTAADLVRRFIQDYHEKLEEGYLFPRFEKAQKLLELVEVLRVQHQAGRRMTDEIREQAAALKGPADSRKLAEALRAFSRMYRPHKAREDTVLFPAFHSLVAPSEYDALGDTFEDKEHKLFGAEGFQKAVDEVAGLEKALGLYELGQFTQPAAVAMS